MHLIEKPAEAESESASKTTTPDVDGSKQTSEAPVEAMSV